MPSRPGEEAEDTDEDAAIASLREQIRQLEDELADDATEDSQSSSDPPQVKRPSSSLQGKGRPPVLSSSMPIPGSGPASPPARPAAAPGAPGVAEGGDVGDLGPLSSRARLNLAALQEAIAHTRALCEADSDDSDGDHDGPHATPLPIPALPIPVAPALAPSAPLASPAVPRQPDLPPQPTAGRSPTSPPPVPGESAPAADSFDFEVSRTRTPSPTEPPGNGPAPATPGPEPPLSASAGGGGKGRGAHHGSAGSASSWEEPRNGLPPPAPTAAGREPATPQPPQPRPDASDEDTSAYQPFGDDDDDDDERSEGQDDLPTREATPCDDAEAATAPPAARRPSWGTDSRPASPRSGGRHTPSPPARRHSSSGGSARPAPPRRLSPSLSPETSRSPSPSRTRSRSRSRSRSPPSGRFSGRVSPTERPGPALRLPHRSPAVSPRRQSAHYSDGARSGHSSASGRSSRPRTPISPLQAAARREAAAAGDTDPHPTAPILANLTVPGRRPSATERASNSPETPSSSTLSALSDDTPEKTASGSPAVSPLTSGEEPTGPTSAPSHTGPSEGRRSRRWSEERPPSHLGSHSALAAEPPSPATPDITLSPSPAAGPLASPSGLPPSPALVSSDAEAAHSVVVVVADRLDYSTFHDSAISSVAISRRSSASSDLRLSTGPEPPPQPAPESAPEPAEPNPKPPAEPTPSPTPTPAGEPPAEAAEPAPEPAAEAVPHPPPAPPNPIPPQASPVDVPQDSPLEPPQQSPLPTPTASLTPREPPPSSAAIPEATEAPSDLSPSPSPSVTQDPPKCEAATSDLTPAPVSGETAAAPPPEGPSTDAIPTSTPAPLPQVADPTADPLPVQADPPPPPPDALSAEPPPFVPPAAEPPTRCQATETDAALLPPPVYRTKAILHCMTEVTVSAARPKPKPRPKPPEPPNATLTPAVDPAPPSDPTPAAADRSGAGPAAPPPAPRWPKPPPDLEYCTAASLSPTGLDCSGHLHCESVTAPTGVPAPAPTQGHAAAPHRGRWLVCGGVAEGGQYDAALRAYDVAAGKWATPQRRCPIRREGHTAVVVRSKLLVHGGYGPGGFDRNLLSVDSPAPPAGAAGAAVPLSARSNSTISPRTDVCLSARSAASAATASPPAPAAGYFKDVVELDLPTMEWRVVPCQGRAQDYRAKHTAVLLRGDAPPSSPTMDVSGPPTLLPAGASLGPRMVVFGGWGIVVRERIVPVPRAPLRPLVDASRQRSALGRIYEPVTQSRAALQAYVVAHGDGDCDSGGGARTAVLYTTAEQLRNDVALFDVDAATWRLVRTIGGPPPPRAGHTATLVSRTMLVFGGWTVDGTPPLNQTARSPGALSQPSTLTCHPEPRPLNDVWALDTGQWRWRAVDTFGDVPRPRADHSALLVDDFLLVLGGRGPGSKVYASAYQLFLPTNCWRKILCSAAVPRPRFGHTALVVQRRSQGPRDREPLPDGSHPAVVSVLVYGGAVEPPEGGAELGAHPMGAGISVISEGWRGVQVERSLVGSTTEAVSELHFTGGQGPCGAAHLCHFSLISAEREARLLASPREDLRAKASFTALSAWLERTQDPRSPSKGSTARSAPTPRPSSARRRFTAAEEAAFLLRLAETQKAHERDLEALRERVWRELPTPRTPKLADEDAIVHRLYHFGLQRRRRRQQELEKKVRALYASPPAKKLDRASQEAHVKHFYKDALARRGVLMRKMEERFEQPFVEMQTNKKKYQTKEEMDRRMVALMTNVNQRSRRFASEKRAEAMAAAARKRMTPAQHAEHLVQLFYDPVRKAQVTKQVLQQKYLLQADSVCSQEMTATVRGRFRHIRANTALRSRSHDAFENRGVSFFPTTDDDELYYETT